jgi:hypothetical protein
MDPVFTLQWPEFLLANRLQKLLPKSQGYSLLIPVSRQEKGFDLAVIKNRPNGLYRVATIQIKASRAYAQKPPKRTSTKRHRFHTWFNRFEVPKEADFFLLFGLYAPDAARTKKVGPQWYRDCTLLFTQQEMKNFMSSCRTRGGKPDRMFGFGFDDERKVVQTRGDKDRRFKDYTRFLLSMRISLLKTALRA